MLKLPERLAAHFLLWQAGRDLPLSANPFGPALVEVSGTGDLFTELLRMFLLTNPLLSADGV